MIARGTGPVSALALAVALLLGPAACGDGGAATDGGVNTDNQSIIVIHIVIEANVPELHRIRVDAHLANGGIDNTLYFPQDMARAAPITSTDTLALLIPITRDGPVDMKVYGLDAAGNPVASDPAVHVVIAVGERFDVNADLAACTTATCN
jgi:hypothetical protein